VLNKNGLNAQAFLALSISMVVYARNGKLTEVHYDDVILAFVVSVLQVRNIANFTLIRTHVALLVGIKFRVN